MSATTIDRLVRMANQIATEFEHQQPGNGIAATHDHLWHFWDPRMQTAIVAHLAAGGAGLSPVAAAAAARLAHSAAPAPQTPATDFAPGRDGSAASDAG